MELELGTFRVRDLQFGQRTELADSVLVIDRAELERVLLRDGRLAGVQVDLARPGEPTRIIHALDVVEPRGKVRGPGTVFPGFLGPPKTAGQGRTHRLAGVAVVETTPVAWAQDGLSVKEAVIDMAGPAAAYCPFARTLNVVLQFAFREPLAFWERDAAIRQAGLETATYLAEATRQLSPDELVTYRLGPADAALPRLAYVDTLMTEGQVHNTFIYGEVVAGLPTLAHPNELLDGAVVCGNHHIACERNPTYFQQNNPVVDELYRRHGRDLAFAGVILAKTQHVSLVEKERVASYAAKLASLIAADGVVVTHDTAGHAMINLMLICQRCEELGIRTVLVVNELAGADGTDWGLVHTVPEAVAMVSTGNKDELITLPPMERVLGGDEIVDWQGYEDRVEGPAGAGFTTPLRRIYCAATQVGAGHLTGAVY